MIALDTNVIVRFLVQDDPAQATIAGAMIDSLTADDPGYLCREVMVELVWVLERAYRYSRAEVATALEALLSATELEIEAADDAGPALHHYRDGGAGFADLMIASAARRAGAAELVTFDRRAAENPGVCLI